MSTYGSDTATQATDAAKQALDKSTGGTTGMSTSSDRKPTLLLNISKDQLKQAPTVDSTNLSSFGDQGLRQRVDSFYSQNIPGKSSMMGGMQKTQGMTGGTGMSSQSGTQSKSKSSDQTAQQKNSGDGSQISSQSNLMRASDIIGMKVKNTSDKDIGKIEDLIVAGNQGQMAYGLVSFGGFMDIGEKTAAVPWQSITLHAQDKNATINATDTQLKAAVVDKNNWQKLSQPEFARQVHSTFGAQPYWEVYGFAPGEEPNKPTDANKPKMDDQKKNKY
jgi:sporulation protein YlmC with PRC-barrel domain